MSEQIEGRNAVLEAFRSGRSVDKLYILDGCQDGPVRTIVREELAAQEARRNHAEASGWAGPYIQKAIQAGILAGVDDGKGGKTIARPQGISTREEMATMGVAILEEVRRAIAGA